MLIVTLFNNIFNMFNLYNINLFYLINHNLHNNILNIFFLTITNLGNVILLFILSLLMYLIGNKKTKNIALLCILTLVITNIIVYLLKIGIAEPRPFLILKNVILMVQENEVYSFPSGHTASIFAIIYILINKYKDTFKFKILPIILISLASIIGISRVYIGVHYPIDIIGGSLIGITVSYILLKIENIHILTKVREEII